MKDQLEDFVRRNRSEFDDREPSPRVWQRIGAEMGFGSDNRNAMVLWRAAAIFFMALSAYLLIPGMPGKARFVSVNENNRALQEFSDIEQFYSRQISQKVELIGQMNDIDGLNGFTHDFHQLEAMYQVLKEEMKTRPSQKVKDALVLNLLVRIDLLNQQLHRLEAKQEKKTV